MKMRAPMIPLITVDPYFSVWSCDRLTDRYPGHWTGSRNAMRGTVTVDGTEWRFLGEGPQPALTQTAWDMDALTTTYTFEGAGIRLNARFTTPLLIEELYYTSRPVSYLHLSYESTDGVRHTVSAKLSVSEELVLNRAGEGRALAQPASVDGVSAVKMGNGHQRVLWRSGDDVRIDWGYLYLGARGNGQCGHEVMSDLYAVYAQTELQPEALFLFGYDDVDSLQYFGRPVAAYWKADGKTIEQALSEAAAEYESLYARCAAFAANLQARAVRAGGEDYAELLALAYRQVLAAHKLAVDEKGDLLYISKECFSGGFAATVDVTYPSAPLFLLYNPELLKGMLRPVFRFAHTDAWPFDFAPHDAGQYPLVNGQVYGLRTEGGTKVLKLEDQMPVEECGNILILLAAIGRQTGDYAMAAEQLPLLHQWSRYLEQYGEDPGEQLCTDDFAGWLAHNVNLSMKAVMGLAGFADILRHLGEADEANRLDEVARRYAESVYRRAQNPDGSCRLAFGAEGTFSLKYNAVWDKLWGTNLFPPAFYRAETARYLAELLPYGVPLDSRRNYTKSDWEVWAACLSERPQDFEVMIHALWNAYHTMHTRWVMTDWYHADTSNGESFRHRTVQGGLFIKLLFDN